MSSRVACSVEHAFEIWTARTSLWWPADHTVSGEDDVQVVIEPRAGGRIFERGPSGREEEWGEVLEWEPPRRLVYLWHLRADRADATEVEIVFTPDGAGPEGGGEALEGDPPRRLVYLWHLRADRADATEVEIVFTPDGAGTEVRIDHRG